MQCVNNAIVAELSGGCPRIRCFVEEMSLGREEGDEGEALNGNRLMNSVVLRRRYLRIRRV